MVKHNKIFCLFVFYYFLIILLATAFLLKYCHTPQEASRNLKTHSLPKKQSLLVN